MYERTTFISFSSWWIDRQCAAEAGKEFPNLVVGEEGHVNNFGYCDRAKEPPPQFRPPSREGLYFNISHTLRSLETLVPVHSVNLLFTLHLHYKCHISGGTNYKQQRKQQSLVQKSDYRCGCRWV